MNHNYSHARYLFLLLSFFVCSVGIAQTKSPLQKTNAGNAKTAIQATNAKQEKEQVLKKKNDPDAVQSSDSGSTFLQKEESEPGTPLSKSESESIDKRIKQSPKKATQSANYTAGNGNSQDSTKVRSYSKSANLTARNIFEVKKADFNLSTSDKMQLKSSSDKNGRNLVTYQQLHNSVPVEGSVYKVREGKTKIDAFGHISNNITAKSNYTVNAARGLEIALNTVNAKQYVWESKKLSALVNKNISTKPTGELVYVGPNFSSQLTEYHLAWKYDIFATNPQSSQTMYVDANTGKVILKIDLSRDVHVAKAPIADPRKSIGKGKARYAGDVTFGTKQYADGFKLETDQGKFGVPIYTLNMHHEDYPSDEILTDYVDQDNNWNDLYNKDHDEAAIDIHWGLQKTIDYYEEKFNRNSVDDKGMTIFGLAHLGTKVENASWTGGWAQFGDGDNVPFVSLAITGHELTHAVTQFSAGLIYQGESGAMNESFSDIFGISIEFYAGRDTQEDIWMLGDELYSHGSLRSMSNPKAENQPDTYGGEFWTSPANVNNDNGGVHTNSGITNYWYYLLVEGGEGVNDLNNSYKVKAIGLEKAQKIAYITLTEYLSPSSTFSDMRQASLMAVEDLYGLDSEEYRQVTNAWYAIGVGAAYADEQISLVSVVDPTIVCGTLKGDEPFNVTIKNTGTTTLKAGENINYMLRLMINSRGVYRLVYGGENKTITLAKDLAVGEERTIQITDNIPYLVTAAYPNYVEVKMDLKPITAFGTSDGVSFISHFYVLPSQKDYDLKLISVNLPDYTGEVLTTSHPLTVTISNLGCAEIPAGTILKVGYLNTAPGNNTVWKDVTLAAALKNNEELTIPFDETIDLSAAGLHTYEAYVTYDKDPVATNNSAINAVYNGVVTQFPYTMDFERTPGGWSTESLNSSTQKFIWQASPLTFRATNSKYLWSCVPSNSDQKMAINANFTLESPIFDFTNVVSPYVEFDMAYLFHKGYDGLIVEYSEDKGKTWKKVQDVSYPETLHYNEMVEGPWYTGINTNFKKDPLQIRLNELKGKKVAFRFHVITDDYNDGFIGPMIDNIFVGDAPYDLNVVSASLDAGKCDINNANASVKIKIANNFPTTAEQVNVSTQILDSAKNVLFSKNEKATLNFTKYKDTITYIVPNIDLKTIGEATISVSVYPEDIAKDVRSVNNALTYYYDNWNNADMKITSLPYIMDFEDASKYKGWRTFENKDGSGWKYGERVDLSSPGWFLEDHTHFMASNDDKCNCDASNDMLVSPVLDLTNYKEAHLSFDAVGDAQHLSDGYVKVSIDGGVTWNEVFHMPYYGEWFRYNVDLSAYAGKSCVMVAFKHDDNGLFASGFAVDNIEIDPAKDYLYLSNLVTAEKVYEDAPSHEFYIDARNEAYKTLDKITIKYQIFQNGTAVGDAVSLEKVAAIRQGETLAYTINGLPNLEAGSYEIKVQAAAEGQAFNDAKKLTASFEVITKASELSGENFTNLTQGSIFGSNGYVSNQSDENYPWRAVITPDNEYLTVPLEDRTGDTNGKLLYNQLEGPFYYGELISPVYKLNGNATAIEFYYASQSNVSDALIVDVKQVGGDWSEVWKATSQGDHVDTEWQKAAFNVTKYAGKSVMFRFRHAKSGGYSYLVVDDLKVLTEPVLDVAMEILSPKDVCGSDEYKVKLRNEGQMAIAANSIKLNLEYVNTSEIISEDIAAGIPVGGSIEYTFKTQPKLEVTGDSHVFNFVAQLDNDIILQNNEIKNYTYQKITSDFKIFDNPVIHGYAEKTLYIDAQTNFSAKELKVDSFKWNTGAVTNDLIVDKAGDYTVTAVLKNGCTLTETVKVTFDTFESDLASGDVCGPEVVLNPGKYKSYEWFDGSTKPTYSAKESGEYYVTVYNENGLGITLSTTISILENTIPEIQVASENKISASADATGYQWYLNGRPIPNATQKSVATIWEGDYSLQVTNSNGCNSMSEVINSKGLLVGKLTNAFRIFPNPAVDNVNIFLADKIEGQTEITIYAMDGTALWSKTYTNMPSSVNVSGLSSGVYILDCVVQGKKYTAKVIKQ